MSEETQNETLHVHLWQALLFGGVAVIALLIISLNIANEITSGQAPGVIPSWIYFIILFFIGLLLIGAASFYFAYKKSNLNKSSIVFAVVLLCVLTVAIILFILLKPLSKS